MTLPSSIADRLSKLIPRLASDHDGEIVNTVHAIRRTLESAGQDLHDLAARLAGDRPRPKPPEPRGWNYDYEPPRPRSGPMRWRHLFTTGDQIIALDGIKALALSPWEREFVRTIDAQLWHSPNTSFSAKQIKILDGLLRRVAEEVS